MARSTLLPLDIAGPDTDALTLRSPDLDDTVGSLADRLGSDGGRQAVDVAVVAGPSVTGWRPLAPGRHLIGRSPHASIRIDDPGIEPHHALLRIEEDCTFSVVQLTGVVPLRVADRSNADTETRVWFSADSRFTLGASVIEFRRPSGTQQSTAIDDAHGIRDPTRPRVDRPSGSLAAHPSDPRGAPPTPQRWNAGTVTAPSRPVDTTNPPLAGSIGAAMTACGAVVLARIVGNPLFVSFAAVTVIASFTTFAVGRVMVRRATRRTREVYDRDLARFESAVAELHRRRCDFHAASHPNLAETVTEVVEGGCRLWQHRPAPPTRNTAGSTTVPQAVTTGDSLSAVVGTARCRWVPPIEVPDRGAIDPSLLHEIERCTRLDDAAAPMTIRNGDAIALHGMPALTRSVARSVIVQMATWTGPADWQLVIVTADERAWRWADRLPHGALDGRSVVAIHTDPAALGERLDAIDIEHRTLLVTDAPGLLASRTGVLRRFLETSGAASLVVVETDATVPAMCRRVLTVGSTGSATWTGDVPESDDAIGIDFVGISAETADDLARRLACVIDPEDVGGAGDAVPPSVSFAELIARSDTTGARRSTSTPNCIVAN